MRITPERLSLVLGSARVTVDHLHAQDKDGQRTENDGSTYQEDIRIAGRETRSGPNDASITHRAIRHHLAEEGNANRASDCLDQIVKAQGTTRFLGSNGERCGIDNRLIEERSAEVIETRSNAETHDLATRNQECNCNEAKAHACKSENNGRLTPNLTDNRTRDEAHDSSKDDGPNKQVGNLKRIKAEHIHANIVNTGVQGIAEEVADKDDNHGHCKRRVGGADK